MEENKIRIEKKKKKVSKWCDRIELIGKGGKAKRAGKERRLTSIALLLFSSWAAAACLSFSRERV